MKRSITFIALLLPLLSIAQFTDLKAMMEADDNPKFEDYETIVYEASDFILNNPVDLESKEFISATEIMSFWMNKDTGIRIPAFGEFYKTLTNDNQQQFLYIIAMNNYILDQKINNDRFLECKSVSGQKFSEQADVREVQLEGAKILLEYVGDKNNNVWLKPKTKRYLKAYRKGELEEVFFQK